MLKFEIPMFYTLVFYVEGDPKSITRQINQVMKKYGFLHTKEGRNKYTGEFDEGKIGRTIYLHKDKESELIIPGGRFGKAAVIAFNTESSANKAKSTDKTKQKISTISHEIRHVVDTLMSMHSVVDIETPAYLTGWLSGEIISEVLKKD